MATHKSGTVLSQENQKDAAGKPAVYLLAILLICSVVINVLLARKIQHLRYIEAALREDATLQIGAIVPAVEAKDLDGNPIVFPYGDLELPSVYYVLSPTCTWCMRNEKNIAALSASLVNKYRFVILSVSPDGLKEYLQQRHIAFPVYSQLSDRTFAAYKLGGTPRTIVVSSHGKVLKNWTGAYADDLKNEIESYFHVRLPGLTQVER